MRTFVKQKTNTTLWQVFREEMMVDELITIMTLYFKVHC